MLGVRNCRIEGWKCLAIAVSTENIPWIKSLSILERIKQAAQRTYSSKNYDEADYQLSYLIYKIGGRSAANIAHKALGIPSIDTSKEHMNTMPLISSSKFPTTTDLIANVSTCFGNSTRVSAVTPAFHQVTKGVVMQVDELKIQERLRWDPTSNQILGVCREHTSDCQYPLSLEFWAMHQADALLRSSIKYGPPCNRGMLIIIFVRSLWMNPKSCRRL